MSRLRPAGFGAPRPPSRFFSLDSPKAIKARGYGFVNAINYMAPAATAGVGNLCPNASPGCLALCLGWFSGQAGMLSNAELETGTNAVRASRVRKSQLFMTDRPAFMAAMAKGISSAMRAADRLNLKLCVRPNGATDIAFEAVKTATERNIFRQFPDTVFVDYTKSVKRMLRSLTDTSWPANYHLTFSRSETNERECREVLYHGGNVAVVFAGPLPRTYLGYPVANGDEHDLRHLDPRGRVIGLSPKGRKAARDTSGFVVRL